MPARGMAVSRERGYLPADVVTLAYLGLVALLVLVSPLRAPLPAGLIAWHAAFLAVTIALRWAPRGGHPWVRFLRVTHPLIGLPVFYSGVQHLSRLVTSGYHDEGILRLEEACFHCQPSQLMHQWLPWVPLSELLHLAYGLYILLVPIGVFVLLGRRRFTALTMFTTSVMGTFFVCYLVFIFFPVKGPFQHIGPIDPAAKGVLFPQLVHRMLTHGSSVGTAFPSSHVAAAVTVWWVTRAHVGRWSLLFLLTAAGIFVGTVYGGYHYALDAVAGLAVGVAGGALWPRFHHWLCARLGVESASTGAARGSESSARRAADQRLGPAQPSSAGGDAAGGEDPLDREPAVRLRA